jgi:hypothetical protein
MNVRLEYSSEFISGVHWDNSMLMNNYTIRLYMMTNCSDSGNQNIAFERLKYYIHNQLNHSVFINQNNNVAIENYNQAGIRTLELPAEPVDQLLGIVLYCKLNAIMEGRLVINEIEISSDLGERMIYLHAADENLGPFEETGWWHSVDLPSKNVLESNSDKVVAMNNIDAWRELELDWSELSNSEQDNTVVFADFGKDDTK